MTLTTGQARCIVERARAVLAEEPPSMYELGDMAARIGRLEWHLEELLALAGQLAPGLKASGTPDQGAAGPAGVKASETAGGPVLGARLKASETAGDPF